jgi:uncharacterized protein (DUF433 family)
MAFTRIKIDPTKMDGTPCIRDLRIPVSVVVGMIGQGMTDEEVLKFYPDLEKEDIREAVQYAGQAVREKTLPLIKKPA